MIDFGTFYLHGRVDITLAIGTWGIDRYGAVPISGTWGRRTVL